MNTKNKLRDHDVAVFLKTQLDVIHTLMEKGVQFLKDKSNIIGNLNILSLPIKYDNNGILIKNISKLSQ